MIVKPLRTRVFKESENLLAFITEHIRELPDNSVLAVTSKIVALAEGRTAIIKNSRTKINLIKAESELAIHTKHVWLAIKDGMAMASAGIDESNADGKLILLPKDSFASAAKLRQQLQARFKVKNLGVLITDSRTLPLRSGVSGVALGYAGFRGLNDYFNKPDIFGRKLRLSKTNAADGLATAAVLVMGEGDEQRPLAVITEAPIKFRNKTDRHELEIDINDDMYKPLFANLPKRRK